MACQVPRFQPMAINVSLDDTMSEINRQLIEQLWTNTAQLLNDTKEAEDELTRRIDEFELSIGGDQEQVLLLLQTYGDDITGLQTATASLTTRVETNEQDIITAGLSIGSLSNDLFGLQQSTASLTTRIDTAEGDITAANLALQSTNTRIDGIDGSITNIQQASAALTARVDTNEGDISQANLDLTSTNVRIDDVDGSITNLQQADATLSTRLDTAEGDISAAELSLSSTIDRVTDAEGDITTLQQADVSIRTRIDTAEGDINTAELNLSSVTNRVTTTEGDITTLENSTASLGTRVGDTEDDVAATTLLLNSTRDRVTDVEGDITSINQSVASINSTAQTASNRATSALNLANTASDDIDDLEARASLVASTTSGGRTRIAGMKATATATTTKLDFIGDSIRFLRDNGTVAIYYDTADDTYTFNGRGIFSEGLYGVQGSWKLEVGLAVDGAPNGAADGASSKVYLGRDGNSINMYHQFGAPMTISFDNSHFSNSSVIRASLIAPDLRLSTPANVADTELRLLNDDMTLLAPDGTIKLLSNRLLLGGDTAEANDMTFEIGPYLGSGKQSIVDFYSNGSLRSYVSGGGSFVVSSSETTKIVESRSKSALSKVGAMCGEGVAVYRRKDNEVSKDNPSVVGMIAEEVKAAMPELVIEDEKAGMAVDTYGLLSVAVNAIAELKAEVDSLTQQVRGLTQ